MVYCRNCGRELPTENAKFCSNCGNITSPNSNVDTTTNYVSEKKGSSKKKIIGIVLGIIVAFFVIIAIAGASVP
ncbi:zinc-ribbon domain-containing protein [Candidatus Nitrosocosmicus sp. R]